MKTRSAAKKVYKGNFAYWAKVQVPTGGYVYGESTTLSGAWNEYRRLKALVDSGHFSPK